MNNVAALTALPVDTYATTTALPLVSHSCQITNISSLTVSTFQIELQSPADTNLEYHAGQYLQLELDVNGDGLLQSLPYSITNSFDPKRPRHLEIFVQNSSAKTDKILNRLFQLSENNATVKVALPMGQAFLQTDLSLTHILIAAGSGISQVKCLTEEILKRRPDTHMTLYWSNRNINDFYLLDEFQEWLNQYKNLNFTPILESANMDWSGRSGYIYEVISEDFENFDDAQVYLCGSPQMVYGTIDNLKAIGLKEENCYSDVFEYAPRN